MTKSATRHPDNENRRFFVLPMLLMLCCLAVHLALQYRACIIDDAFITFRYAENLAQGNGLTYNPPQRVEGYSNLLLLLLLSIGRIFGVPCVISAQAIGLLCLLGLVFMLFEHAEAIIGKSPWALMAPGLFASSSAAAYWAVSGLETMLYTFILTLLIISTTRPRAPSWLVFLSAFALILCRTEGSAPAGIIVLLYALRSYPDNGDFKSRLRSAGRIIAPVVIFMISYHMFRFCYFGSFASAVSKAKWLGSISPFNEGLRYLYIFVIEYLPPFVLFGILFAACAPASLSAPFWATVIFQLLVILFISGDWMPLYRMLVPLFPVAALEASRAWTAMARNLPRAGPAIIVAIILCMLKLSYCPVAQKMKLSMEYKLGCLLTDVGKHIKNNYPSQTRIAVGDIGRIGYYSGMTIIDMKGLVSPGLSDTYHVVAEGSHKRVSFDVRRLLEMRPNLVLVAVHNDSEGRDHADRLRGFWACDTELLSNREFTLNWQIVKRIDAPDRLRISYLLFESRHHRIVTPDD